MGEKRSKKSSPLMLFWIRPTLIPMTILKIGSAKHPVIAVTPYPNLARFVFA